MRASYHRVVGRKTGFTLIELLAATSILILLVMMLAQVFMQTSTMWDRGTSRTDMNTVARAALNLMQRELALAVVDDDIAMLVEDDIIFFVSLIGDPADPLHSRRSIVEIAYYVDVMRDLEGEAIPDRLALYRAASSNNPDFPAGAWWHPTVTTNYWYEPPPGAPPPPPLSWRPDHQMIVGNVHSAEFKYWHLDGAYSPDGMNQVNTSVDNVPPPALIEIALTLIDADTADRWDAYEMLPPEERDALQAAGLYTFNTQVRVRNADTRF